MFPVRRFLIAYRWKVTWCFKYTVQVAPLYSLAHSNDTKQITNIGENAFNRQRTTVSYRSSNLPYFIKPTRVFSIFNVNKKRCKKEDTFEGLSTIPPGPPPSSTPYSTSNSNYLHCRGNKSIKRERRK